MTDLLLGGLENALRALGVRRVLGVEERPNSRSINARILLDGRWCFLKVGSGGEFSHESRRAARLSDVGLGPQFVSSGSLPGSDVHYYCTRWAAGFRSLASIHVDGELKPAHLRAVFDAHSQVELSEADSSDVVAVFETRLLKRWSELRALRPRTPADRDSLRIANDAFQGAAHLMASVTWTEVLWGPVPGDAHFGNILVNQNDRRVLFTDPAGHDSLPLSYDLGKLLQSVHLGYDHVVGTSVVVTPQARSRTSEFSWLCAEVRGRWGEDALAEAFVAEALHSVCLLPHHFYDPARFAALARSSHQVVHAAVEIAG